MKVADAFWRHVRRTPDAVAMWEDSRTYSYDQLGRMINGTATRLARLAADLPGPLLVDIPARSSGGAVVAAIACAEVGLPFSLVPDPDGPVRLPSPAELDLVLKGEHLQVRVRPCPPDAVGAHMIVRTSGTSAVARQIVVPRSVVTHSLIRPGFVDLSRGSVTLQWSNPSWDAWGLEVLGPLLNGGAVAVHGATGPDFNSLVQQVDEAGVTFVQATASVFNVLVDDYPDLVRRLSVLMTAGERASAHHVSKALRCNPELTVINGYGPAELYGISTAFPIRGSWDSGRQVPIGFPVKGVETRIVNRACETVPDGEPGELILLGDKVTLGYLGRAGETAARFVAAGKGGRAYRTGDIVRQDSDGCLQFEGRAEHTLKVRGRWVDPVATETAILSLPGVRDVCVLARQTSAGAATLGALVATKDRNVTVDTIAAALTARDISVPSHICFHEELPRNDNGKRDLSAVRELLWSAPAPPTSPRRTAADVVTDLVHGILALPVDPRLSFIANGGDSLSAFRLIARVERSTGRSLTLGQVVRAPSLIELAREITRDG